LRALRASGVRVVNDPDAIHKTSDKHNCAIILAAAGVPVPSHLLLSSDKESKRAAVRMLGPRMITKPVNGSLGRDVALVPDAGVLDRMRTKDDTIAQQYVPDAAHGDLRVFVVGKEVVASMLRVPARGEHRANLARGGTGFFHEPTKQEKSVAVAAVSALGLTFGGVDMVPTPSGPVVLEVNSRPGHKIAEITDRQTREAIADEVARIARAAARREGKDV
jgi:RimK family alpha-L-glutamate ligase